MNDAASPGATSRSATIVARDRRAIARPGGGRIPLVVAGGTGAVLRDVDGRAYTDLTSGWNVANTGWNHPRLVERLRRQLGESSFAPTWCSHERRVEAAERLAELCGGDRSALCATSGSEAVEMALKVARRATGRHAIVGFREAYHGWTLGAALAGGVASLHGVDLPDDGWHRCAPLPERGRGPAADSGRLATDVICAEPLPAAVILEPIFTNPGVLYGWADFYRAVQAACERVGALLIVDEIGTGFGRTGRMFGFQHFALDPDIVVLAKAITSGAVPMGAAILRRDLVRAVAGRGFAATFAWTPLACAAALATLDIVEGEELVDRSRRLGELTLSYLAPRAAGLPGTVEVRGFGLEIGIELAGDDGGPLPAVAMRELSAAMLRRGVFAEWSAYTSTLLVMPPLVIHEADLLQALDVVVEEIHAIRTSRSA